MRNKLVKIFFLTVNTKYDIKNTKFIIQKIGLVENE